MTQRIKNDFLFGVCFCEWNFLFKQLFGITKNINYLLCKSNKKKPFSNSFLRLQVNSEWPLGQMAFLCVSIREI